MNNMVVKAQVHPKSGMIRRSHSWLPFAMVAAVICSACTSMEYSIRERLGQQKRKILVDRVDKARETQQAAQDQFVSALDSFKSVTGFEGRELEAKHREMRREYDRSVRRADDVTRRIRAVEDVARALFQEWEGELAEYTSRDLRESSERRLRETQHSYEGLIESMRAAEKRMQPVLNLFHDQVLYLKHNLNARAVASVDAVSDSLEAEIDALVADMQRAIDEANRFIVSLQGADD